IVVAWDVEHDPAKTLRLTSKFVGDAGFPASPFLHWAYDHGARAAFESGLHDDAVEKAFESLRLRPENPGLHLQLALHFERESEPRAAADHALQALIHLEVLYRRRALYTIDSPDRGKTAVEVCRLIARVAYSPNSVSLWATPQRRRILSRVIMELSRLLATKP